MLDRVIINTQTLQKESKVDFRYIRLAHRLRPSTCGDSAMLWDMQVVVQANQTKTVVAKRVSYSRGSVRRSGLDSYLLQAARMLPR